MTTCNICNKLFYSKNSLVKCCGYDCALIYARQQQQKVIEKSQRKVKKEGLEKLKTKSDYLKEVQTVFNAYIRKRDEGNGCISCETNNGQMHAGHYRSTSVAPHLRFNEDNVHKQCAKCNTYLSANLINYRIRLIKKIGSENVELLENNNSTLRVTIEELKELKEIYKNKIKLC